MNDQLIIGMLSGTSRDGVDAVLVSFRKGAMDILHASCTPYPTAITVALEQLLETGKPPGDELSTLLDDHLGHFFARVAQTLVREAGMETRDIRAIGSHGQSVWHQPVGDKPVSIQLGRGDLLARNTGITVVCNFRSADVLAGGQGAPLAPLLHQHLFRSETENRAVLNIGGIANLTVLPATGGIAGFDSGPGNCLMDAWSRTHLHKDYDDHGSWARKGRVDAALLETLLSDSYFGLPAPKSTGLEHFNSHWLNRVLADFDIEPVNVQATLSELTALSIANSLEGHAAVRRLLVCGGGVHNSFLMRRIAAALPDAVVEPTTRHGADPDWLEGLLFAWLARERLNETPQDTRRITGSARPVLLGEIYDP